METIHVSPAVEEMAQLADARFHSSHAEILGHIDDLVSRYPAQEIKEWALVAVMHAVQSVTLSKGVKPTGVEVRRLVGPAMVVVWDSDIDDVTAANELITDLAQHTWGGGIGFRPNLMVETDIDGLNLMVRMAIATSIRVALIDGVRNYGDPIRAMAAEMA